MTGVMGGVVVMIIFIAFVVWKGKNNTRDDDSFRRLHEEQYWAEKDSMKTEVTSFEPDYSDAGDDD